VGGRPCCCCLFVRVGSALLVLVRTSRFSFPRFFELLFTTFFLFSRWPTPLPLLHPLDLVPCLIWSPTGRESRQTNSLSCLRRHSFLPPLLTTLPSPTAQSTSRPRFLEEKAFSASSHVWKAVSTVSTDAARPSPKQHTWVSKWPNPPFTSSLGTLVFSLPSCLSPSKPTPNHYDLLHMKKTTKGELPIW
jgi:hypothetical protein